MGQIAGPVLAGNLADRQGRFAPALTLAAGVVLLGGSLMAALRRLSPRAGGVRDASSHEAPEGVAQL